MSGQPGSGLVHIRPDVDFCTMPDLIGIKGPFAMTRIISGIMLYSGFTLGMVAIAYIIICDARELPYSQKTMAIICSVSLGMIIIGGMLTMVPWLISH